jgi:hypothetical protein
VPAKVLRSKAEPSWLAKATSALWMILATLANSGSFRPITAWCGPKRSPAAKKLKPSATVALDRSTLSALGIGVRRPSVPSVPGWPARNWALALAERARVAAAARRRVRVMCISRRSG